MKAEKQAVRLVLGANGRPALPCTVVLTRVAPSNGLDGDNLAGALKGCRDAVADWLGIDDRDPLVRWEYQQRRGAWGVEINLTRSQS